MYQLQCRTDGNPGNQLSGHVTWLLRFPPRIDEAIKLTHVHAFVRTAAKRNFNDHSVRSEF